MVYINDNFTRLPETYLFSEIAKRVQAFKNEHPEAQIIRMGIGDVTLPLPKTVIEAMHKAVDEMATGATFKGYGPEQGYSFLIDKIIEYDTITKEEEQWNQVNPSCLLAYLGIRGFANMVETSSKDIYKNALPILAYYDIFKNYYANTQEEELDQSNECTSGVCPIR